jgi:hypothetical protein
MAAAVLGEGPLEAGSLKDLCIMNRMLTDRNREGLLRAKAAGVHR